MQQLEPGFTADGVTVPHVAVRLVLYGLPINKYLSAKITYMRPVNWVQYRNVNGDLQNHSVWMNIAGLTLQGRLPLSKKISVSGEAGLGVITRNGFEINGVPVVKNANYGTGLFGGAIQYHLNKKWDLQLMDMARTSVNVIGNTLASCVIARWEGEFDDDKALAFNEQEADAIRD